MRSKKYSVLGDNQAVYGDAGFFDSIVITDINGSYRTAMS